MTKDQKITLIRIIIGLAMLVGGIWVKDPSVRLVYYIVAYVIAAYDVFIEVGKNIIHFDFFDENFLMGLASVGALCLGEYPEAVAIMVFYQVGELFQDIAVDRSRDSITSLMDIRPEYANLEKGDGTLEQVDPETVPAGSVIVVKPGERVPLDGVVVSGNSSLDTVALTGESRPRDVAEGNEVLNGSVNMTGVLRLRTSGVYAESTVARILELVEHADWGKAKTEKFITRFARIYTPVVFTIALVLGLAVPAVFGHEWGKWIHRALIFLVISCPCALVVSVPLTFFAGIGAASKHKVLVKGSQFLETLAAIRAVVFDKTGTLTEGVFTVTAVRPQGVSEAELLETAALAEIYSDHPVAVSLREAWAKELDRSRVGEMENFAGEGLRAVVDGRNVYAGNLRLMNRLGITPQAVEEKGTIVYVAVDGDYAGYIVIADKVKPTAAATVEKLKRLGVCKVAMLTGDREDVAREMAEKLGITDLHAELLPVDKVEWVREMREGGPELEKLAFVGDGINDAPVLKLSDVGVAMGGVGSQAAIEAADVVLMDDDPMRVAEGISIARKTLRIAKENIWFSLAIKACILVLGAIGIANMWVAVFADVGVLILAILNALRAMRVE
ncbi:MAG: cadmium-translocating P-type ATPase [Bacteroidales bacterium]|nr:cadmium-translocating P-type ATPase [Bacteroidales bacterium]